MPNKNILENLNKFVKEELDKETIPSDAKYVLVGTVDNNGAKIIAAVNIKKSDKINTKVEAVWEHDWTGDDTVAGKIIFVGK
jgi:hypothetical protein